MDSVGKTVGLADSELISIASVKKTLQDAIEATELSAAVECENPAEMEQMHSEKEMAAANRLRGFKKKSLLKI